MITIEELIQKSDQKRTKKVALNHRYIFKPGSDPKKEIAALYAYFASHEDSLAIDVYHGGKKLGCIDRDTVLYSINDLDKDLGTGDHSFLYGEPKDYCFVLKCPQPGCKQRMYLAYYDPNEKMPCPDHQDRIMNEEEA